MIKMCNLHCFYMACVCFNLAQCTHSRHHQQSKELPSDAYSTPERVSDEVSNDSESASLTSEVENEEESLQEHGYCKDDIYTEFLKQQYLKNAKMPRYRSQISKRRWRKRTEVEALHHATDRLTEHTSNYFGAIPVVVTPEVENWIRYFKTRGRQSFIKWMIRGKSVESILSPLLHQEGMPAELFYLSMIESGFNNKAYSTAKATGPWQFVSGTARMYGLKMNYWLDERRDPVKSTIAAATYLRDLYGRFGDWYLAMAAYNAGPGKVNWAIRKAGSRNFWDISKKRFLKLETRNYVPKMLAALILGANPEKHGFSIKENPADALPVDHVLLEKPTHLPEIGSLLGVSTKQIKYWNPELTQDISPPWKYIEGSNGYPLRLPKNLVSKFASIKDQLSTVKIKDVHLHKIRSGETLTRIAKKYNVSVQKIKTFNPKISPRRLRIGKKIAIPIPSVITIDRKPSA